MLWGRFGAALLGFLLLTTSTASAVGFSPGRFAVRGAPLFGRVAGHSVNVFARPASVSVDGCVSRKPMVRLGHRSVVAVAVALTCRSARGHPRLTATIRGSVLKGRVRVGGRSRSFRARRVVPAGKLLRGKPTANALGAVTNVAAFTDHPDSERSAVARATLIRTEVVIEIGRSARVRDVNAALSTLGGRIEGSVAHTTALLVTIPDPGSVQQLDRVLALVRRMHGIRHAFRSYASATSDLPTGPSGMPVGSPAELDALSHLLELRMPEAWNARAALHVFERPTVLVEDFFGAGPFQHLDARQIGPGPVTSPGADDHGYHVAGIMAGDFADDGSAAGLVTGAFPTTTNLAVVDLTDQMHSATDEPSNYAMQLALEQAILDRAVNSQHIVVNTSLRFPGESADQILSDGSVWAHFIRANGLEDRVLQATAAGNEHEDAANESAWTAAALRSDLYDITSSSTSSHEAPLANTLVVESVKDTGAPAYGPGCISSFSNTGGTIAAVGDSVYSLLRNNAAGNLNGTSMATPQIAALAEWLWTIDPSMTAPQVASVVRATAARPSGCERAGPADAFAATLSLDQPGATDAAGAPVRFALLDQNHDHVFNETDLRDFADHLLVSPPATTRDWSRWDLNGDGFTGGPNQAPFDLDTSGSTRGAAPKLTTVSQSVKDSAGNPVTLQLDERGVTDADILCYYAYSNMYTPAATNDQRDQILGDVCAPVEVKSCSTSTFLTASASVPSDVTGGPHKSNTISANPVDCSPPIAAAPPALIASDAGTCNVPTQQPCQAQSKAASTINAAASVHAGSASLTVAFTGNADATVITGGSSHADVDGNSSISFQLNTTCNYSVSGSVSASPNNVDSSAVAELRVSGSSAGAVFTLTGGSGGQQGTLTAGTYSFLTSGEATGSGTDPAGAGGHASVSNSGTLTLTC